MMIFERTDDADGRWRTTETDEALYERCLSGENDALRQLLDRYGEGLTLFLYGIVGSMEDAEDLMMDAFAALLARDTAFAGRSSFKTWLFAIGRHKAVSFLRRRHLEVVFIEETAEDLCTETADFHILKEERRRRMLRAMGRLKPEYRQALMLTYFEEMDREEAARVMRRTEKQISDLLYHGKQALRAALESEGFTDAEL